ncbi:MAG: FHA domain-containing protein, partial [Planctomycetota bacterium]
MTHRFALRFEEGERRGEIVALTGATTTFGRKPGNSVQMLDPSISGKHAELVVDERGVLLRDLGSTNGTRVNGERISEKRLSGGDRIMLGSVDLVFVDGEQPKPAPGADDIGLELEADHVAPAQAVRAPSAMEMTSVVRTLQTPSAEVGDAVRSIGAEKLARSRQEKVFV